MNVLTVRFGQAVLKSLVKLWKLPVPKPACGVLGNLLSIQCMRVKYLHFSTRKSVRSDQCSSLYLPCPFSPAYFLLHTGCLHLLGGQVRAVYENHCWKEPGKYSDKTQRSHLPFIGKALNCFHFCLWSSHNTVSSRCLFCASVAKRVFPLATKSLLKNWTHNLLFKEYLVNDLNVFKEKSSR